MHSTEHKYEACQIKPWDARNADRRCEHGDTRLKASWKRTARKNRRQADKKESQRD